MLYTLSQIQQLTYFTRHKTLAVLLGGTESPAQLLFRIFTITAFLMKGHSYLDTKNKLSPHNIQEIIMSVSSNIPIKASFI